MKTPAYYKSKPNDIDRSLLTNVPDAPRVPQPGLPTGYDWTMFGDDSNRQSNVSAIYGGFENQLNSNLKHSQNNVLRKSQSNYESYNILSDDPPTSGHLKRHSSTELLRSADANHLSPTLARLTRSPAATESNIDNTSELMRFVVASQGLLFPETFL